MSALSTKSTTVNVTELLHPCSQPVEFVPQRSRPEGMVVGQIRGFDENGSALVLWQGLREESPQPSQTTVPLGQQDLGREVVLAFVTVDHVLRPIIMGFLQKPSPLPCTRSAPVQGWNVQSDGKRMVLSAQEEIVLCCGKASITLTKAGKVLLEGDYVLSRSSGVNRIKGGSVQIN